MELVNLTPHDVHFVAEDGTVTTIRRSGLPAPRVGEQRVPCGEAGGVRLYQCAYGTVYGLPDPVPGRLLIVSGMIRAALPARSDLASPAELVRDAEGKITGARGLDVNGSYGS